MREYHVDRETGESAARSRVTRRIDLKVSADGADFRADNLNIQTGRADRHKFPVTFEFDGKTIWSQEGWLEN